MKQILNLANIILPEFKNILDVLLKVKTKQYMNCHQFYLLSTNKLIFFDLFSHEKLSIQLTYVISVIVNIIFSSYSCIFYQLIRSTDFSYQLKVLHKTLTPQNKDI